jgi:hypothetical protein
MRSLFRAPDPSGKALSSERKTSFPTVIPAHVPIRRWSRPTQAQPAAAAPPDISIAGIC